MKLLKRRRALSESLSRSLKRRTLHHQPGRRLQALHAEGEGARVLHRQVGDGEAVNFPFGTHAKMICGLELDSISHPVASDVGMGELHFK